jgi:hypothetical protein
MTITGNFVDSTNNNPIGNVTVDLFLTGDMSVNPDDSFESDGSGNYSYTSTVADSSTSSFNVQTSGYQQYVGSPGLLQGTQQLVPTQTTSIPVWIWILLGLLVVGYYLHSTGKLKF